MDTMGIYTISLARGLDIPKVKRFKLEVEKISFENYYTYV